MDVKIFTDYGTLHTCIGQLLQQAGWEIHDPAQVSCIPPSATYASTTTPAFLTYCLYSEDGQVIAVVEAGITCLTKEADAYPIVQYAAQLAGKQLVYPFAFQTNGQAVFMWNEQTKAMEAVGGFIARPILKKMLQRSIRKENAFLNSALPQIDSADNQLWSAFKKGDYTAFTQIYKKHIQPLYNFGSKITSDRALIEDCIHDLFVELWKSRTKLSDVNTIQFYLIKALKRKLLRSLGKKTAQLAISEEYSFESVFSHEFALITSQVTQEQEQNLAKALATLSDRQREAIFLRFYEGFSYEEIASVMTISVKTAYNFVYMALIELRKNLVHLVPCLLLIHTFTSTLHF